MYLQEFLETYKEWLEHDAPDGVVFHRKYGLCSNAFDYADHFYPGKDLGQTIWNELKEAFRKDNLSVMSPFNKKRLHCQEEQDNDAHLNQERREWVYKRTCPNS